MKSFPKREYFFNYTIKALNELGGSRAFTREATIEASSDGAPVIYLIDGDLLVEKLKELRHWSFC
ncbi:hypothetical protein [Kordia sp.]|uniref:hypothetical protein n=1 Tax=Kordia sp. TaxID=1965332 RepID=UPI0025BB890A|nr:hypothetical protein [Kordia sp.]MCH2195651.1 hypothetical protein [Kordia sp.]